MDPVRGHPDSVGGSGGWSPASRAVATSPVASYLLPDSAETSADGRLLVAGVDMVELAHEVGTPVFVYDEGHLRARCREAVSAWGEGVAYASKAFLCKAMASIACEEGMWLDVSTGGEMQVALAAGVPPSRLVLHGNNKSAAELEAAISVGVGRLVVDSFDEIDRLARIVGSPRSWPSQGGDDALRRGAGALEQAHFGQAQGSARTGDQQVMVRVTPGIEAHTHEFVRTGQDDSKFGFSLSSGAAGEAVRRLSGLSGVQLVGVHAHIGSQVFVVDFFEREVDALAPFFIATGLKELCVGGGLGVPYVAGEAAPSIGEWAAAVKEACALSGIPAGTRITAEPGRSVVATAGLTLYTVGTIKELPGLRTYVAVDGGMSDNPRPVLYGSGYEAFMPREVASDRTLPVRVVGKHCESGDVLVADGMVPADIVVGDVLAVPVTGAYGYSMASTYNKVPRPPVVLVSDGSWRVVVRRETYEDLLRLDG